jgi:4-amino-4-deoxy-L-arabinose transferase
MFNIYFDTNQTVLLLTGTLFLIISIFFYLKKKYKIAIIILLLGTFALYMFAALLDPFLNIWDERFHALVAKNIMKHPLMPTLYDDPVVNILYDRWDRLHIWLHKQPLFLWQIALSFKIFGVSEFALRLPSALSGVFLVLIGYRSAKLLVNQRVGYYTAFLFVTSFYIIELIAGRQELEHNDISFLVNVSGSIWAWIEYIHSKRKYWIYIIGIFSGFAILCKWLVGLLVYLGWILFNFLYYKWNFSKYKDIIISLIITTIISLPWQLLIFHWYPTEANLAYEFNIKHFTEVLDGHSGSYWYHLDQISVLFGRIVPFIILPAFFLFYKKIYNKKIFISLIAIIISVYIFFSFAKTKMPSFTIVAALPIYISLACFIDYILSYIQDMKLPQLFKQIIIFIFIVFLGYSRLDVEMLQEKHNKWKKENQYSKMLMNNKTIFESLKNKLPKNTVLFNVKGRHYIEAMFYTGLPSYNIIPTNEQYNDMVSKGKVIAIFNSEKNKLPDYLENDSTIIIINEILKGYD